MNMHFQARSQKRRQALPAVLLGAMALTACSGLGNNAPSMPPMHTAAPGGQALAAWSFDEGHGMTTRESGSGRMDRVNAVFNQARFKPSTGPVWREHCVVGACLLFDGYSTDIVAPAMTDTQVANGVTIGLWVAPHAYEWGDGGAPSAFVSQFDKVAKEGIAFGAYRHGTWGVSLGLGGTVIELRVSERRLPKDVWSHVAVSFDPRAHQVALFLNGEQVASAVTPANGRLTMPSSALSIGRYSQPTQLHGVYRLNTYLGLMDELRITAGPTDAGSMHAQLAAQLAAHGGHAPALSAADVTIAPAVFDGDRHRPQFHAIPNSGWMNEPHAPFYYRGQYHLFFQKNPFGPYWHQIHWGHWVSVDMVHWRELPIALAPEADDLAPDGIWSGSASYRADGSPVLFFTAGNDAARPNQRTGAAIPSDLNDPDLVRWTKYPAPVTLQRAHEGRLGEFRDPFVFKDGADAHWFQLVGSAVPGGSGTALVYDSTDLVHWNFKGPLMTLDTVKYPGFDSTWELPVLLPLGTGSDGRPRHIYLMDVHAQAYYWVGVFDREHGKFIADVAAPRMFDVGQHHFSGPSGFVDPKTGRSIVFSIAQGERTEQLQSDSGWAHNAGLPVVLSLGSDGDVRIAPIAELSALRRRHIVSLANVSLQAAATVLAAVHGDTLEIELELAPSGAAATRRGLVVRKTDDDAERTAIYVGAAATRFEIDRSKSSLDPDVQGSGVQGGAVDLAGENLRLRVFVDRSMLEAYLNERKSLTSRAYPARQDANGVGLLGAPADRVVALNIWELAASTPTATPAKGTD